jgi:hypothetical protein
LAAGNSSSLSDVEPGLLGFLVVAGLALALVFLLRSMNKQFRKIGPGPDAEDTAAAAADEARDGETAAGAVDDGTAAQDRSTAQERSAGQDADTTAS